MWFKVEICPTTVEVAAASTAAGSYNGGGATAAMAERFGPCRGGEQHRHTTALSGQEMSDLWVHLQTLLAQLRHYPAGFDCAERANSTGASWWLWCCTRRGASAG